MSNALAAQPVNWRPIIALGGLLGLCLLTWVVLQRTRQPPPIGVVGDVHEMRPIKMPNLEPPKPSIITQYIHLPAPAATPKAQPSPCRACQEVVEDYLSAIKTPFPSKRDVYETPPMAAPGPMRAGNWPAYDGFHR